ncbi:hypothetical protein BT63DRAFT_415810 [Microthyrium microscopicum]|uniref:BRCT domain-containing protein n=1 Tax=Microthyrium microscopicum TaxID=703497 RepID=A0A6A6U4Y2_9PEZI|nr:hypothetical protein BT63DRAFT_415810 [Microthyrium microscopicum]
MPVDQARGQAPLTGVVLCCSGLQTEERDRMHRIARELGAACTFDLTIENTHLVIGENKTLKYHYVAKERPDIKVVLPAFIDALLEVWKVNGKIDLPKFEGDHKAPALYGLSISLTGFTNTAEREQVISTIKSYGANYDGDLSRNTTTHLLARSATGKKYLMAPRWQIHAVSEEWLYDSIERGMALDEKLYDLQLPPTQRGKNAWNKNFVPTPPSPGKRARDEDAVAAASGRRKIRRTVSTKLSNHQEAIWADIAAMPIAERQINHWNSETFVEEPAALEQVLDQSKKAIDAPINVPNIAEDQASMRKVIPKSKGALFSGCTIYVHDFPAVKLIILQEYLTSNGATIITTNKFAEIDGDFVERNPYLLIPSDQPIDSLSPIPKPLRDIPRVIEWWVESCLQSKRLFSPAEHTFLRPFYQGKIPDFENVVVSSTGLEGIQRLQLSRVIALWGGTYQESLKKGLSILVSGTPTPKADRAAAAKRLNAPIVSLSWIWECMASNAMMPQEGYLISRPLSSRPKSQTGDGFATFETTKTLTLSTKDLERRISDQSKAARSEDNAQPRQTDRLPFLPDDDDGFAPPMMESPKPASDLHQQGAGSPSTLLKPTEELLSSARLKPTENIAPLQDITAEKLNSPSKASSPSKSPTELENSSAKSDQIQSALAAILEAKRALPRATDAEQDKMRRRKRSGLGRALSSNTDTGQTSTHGSPNKQQKPDTIPEAEVSAMMPSQALIYEDHETRARRQKIMAQIHSAGSPAQDGDVEIVAETVPAKRKTRGRKAK